VMVCVCRPLL